MVKDGNTGDKNYGVLGEAGVSNKGSVGYDSVDDNLVLNDLNYKVPQHFKCHL